MSARIFRFVTHERVESYLSLGWVKHDGLRGTHHGWTASIIEWPSQEIPPCEPVPEILDIAG